MKHTYALLLIFLVTVFLSGCIKHNETKDNTEKVEKVTKRLGQLIKVRPEFEERYIILHENTFPSVLERIRKSNIRNYSIFLLDGILFSNMEYVGSDYDGDMKAIGDEKTKKWWKLTDPMQEPLPTRKPGEWWAEMELLVNGGEKIKSYTEAQRTGIVVPIKPGCEDEIRNIFKNIDNNLFAAMANANIQNFTAYMKDNKVYVYSEYVGKNSEQDGNQFTASPEYKKFNAEFSKYMTGPWQKMKEVFHTN